jgi:general secretion pathway protein I
MNRIQHVGRSAGFTLIEVLVALAVLAITFGFAFSALSGSFDWLDRSERDRAALLIAETMLTRVSHDIALQTGQTTGRTTDGFSWLIETSPYGDVSRLPPGRLIGYRVQVTVSWTERHRARQIRMTTLQLGRKARDS